MATGGFPQAVRGVKDVHDATPQHVSHCLACWQALADRYQAKVGRPPANAARMEELFGCAVVERDLHLLAGVALDAIPSAFPAVAYHVSWCAGCRRELAELLAVAAAVEKVAPAGPAVADWRTARGEPGTTVRELAADFIATVGEGLAAFAQVPSHLMVRSVIALDGARRGPTPTSLQSGRQVDCPLDTSGLTAHLTLDAFGDDTMRLEVALTGAISGPMSAQLSTWDDDELALLGAEPLGAQQAATFRGVPPGRYVVDICEQARQQRFRLRLIVHALS